jgi:hypothetical protein
MSSSDKKLRYLEKRMSELFPTCPICKSDLGYQFSGRIRTFGKCKQCKAKWFLGDYNMELTETSKDGTGFSLIGKAHPYNFWQKLNVEELKAEEKRLIKEKVETEKFREERLTGRDIVFYIFFFNFLINIGVLIYFFLNNLWNSLPSYLRNPMTTLFIYQVLLNFCFLIIVYWVARDEKLIEELRNRVSELQKTKNKRNEQK